MIPFSSACAALSWHPMPPGPVIAFKTRQPHPGQQNNGLAGHSIGYFFLRVIGCYKTPIISTDKQMVWCPFIKKSQVISVHLCL
jgi:hypothetical protein